MSPRDPYLERPSAARPQGVESRLGAALLASEHLSVVVWSGAIECRDANPVARTIFRVQPEDVEVATPDALLPELPARFVRSSVALTLESGEPSIGLVANVAHADDDPAHRLFSFLPIAADATAEELVLAISFDVAGERVLGTRTIADLEREAHRARVAHAEYNRALVDYTQLVRHRIANPLTSVIGGIQTLLDLDLDEATRRELLESMLECARRVEQVSLHPDAIGPEEHELDARPRQPARPGQ